MHKSHESEDIQLSTTTCSLEDSIRPIDRFHAIQEKLDRLGRVKSSNKQLNMQDKIVSKLQAIQLKYTEHVQCVNEATQNLKEMLTEMKVSFQKREKHCSHIIKQRKQYLKDVKHELESLAQQQTKQSIETHSKITQKFKKESNSLEDEIDKQLHVAADEITLLQSSFQRSLPNLHECIETSNNHLQFKISRKQSEIMDASNSFSRRVHRQHREREQGKKQIMQFIQFALDQMQKDLANERRQRRKMKQKLEFIVFSAKEQIDNK